MVLFIVKNIGQIKSIYQTIRQKIYIFHIYYKINIKYDAFSDIKKNDVTYSIKIKYLFLLSMTETLINLYYIYKILILFHLARIKKPSLAHKKFNTPEKKKQNPIHIKKCNEKLPTIPGLAARVKNGLRGI